MAEALPERSTKPCINCAIYDWKQPDQSMLKRCTGCREVWYCGKDCQREHWYNTHKNDCKYLAQKKVLTNAVHGEASCLVCKEEARVGQIQMSSLSNPVLPCTMSKSNMRLMNIDEDIAEGKPPSITLAEMTGQFHTNLEATVTIMMRIMVKMKMSKPVVWQMPSAAPIMNDFYTALCSIRKYIWWSLLFKKPAPLQGQLLFDGVSRDSYDVEMFMTVTKLIHDLVYTGVFGEQISSVFKPLKTMQVLLAIFVEGCCNMPRFVCDCVGIDGISEKVERVRLTYAQFNKMWKNVMNMLKDGLVPFKDLVVKGLCDGSPAQQCYVCEEEISVKDGAWIFSFSPEPAVIIHGSVVYYLCGSRSCKQSIVESSLSKELDDVREQYGTLGWEHRHEICDYCGQLNQEVRGHRCARCLTKVYCGLDCQRNDTTHLMMCKKGDKRKKKRSNGKRKEKGRQEMVGIQVALSEV